MDNYNCADVTAIIPILKIVIQYIELLHQL